MSTAVAAMEGGLHPGAAAAVRAGEISGRLPEVLFSLGGSAQTRGELRANLLLALGYPIVLCLISLGLLAFMAFHVTPGVETLSENLYSGSEDLYSGFAVMPHAISVLSQMASGASLLLLALLVLVFFVFPPAWLPARRTMDEVRIRFPVLGNVARAIALHRWCHDMHTLTAAGAPEPTAVRLAGEACGSEALAARSRRMAAKLESGLPLAKVILIDSSRFFSDGFRWLITASDEAGGHARVWEAAAGFYRSRAEQCVNTASTLLRIVFLLGGYAVVLGTAMALILPLVRLMRMGIGVGL